MAAFSWGVFAPQLTDLGLFPPVGGVGGFGSLYLGGCPPIFSGFLSPIPGSPGALLAIEVDDDFIPLPPRILIVLCRLSFWMAFWLTSVGAFGVAGRVGSQLRGELQRY